MGMEKLNNNVILILLDAFRGDYLSQENTPYLFDLSKKSTYVKRIKPSFGFCERTEILTGKDSIESGYFTALGFDPQRSPYKKFRKILLVFSLIESVIFFSLLKKILRRVFWLIFGGISGTFFPFNIPFKDLHLYSLTEDGENNQILS